MTIIWGLLSIAFSLLLINAESALDIWWQISGIFGGGILGLFLIAISKVKITVLKRTVMKDLVDAYKAGAEETAEHECEVFKEGQEFIVENLGMPEGFCSWAWADIQRDVTVLALGGDFPWIKQKGVGISCCTDGLRPVIFKLERIE